MLRKSGQKCVLSVERERECVCVPTRTCICTQDKEKEKKKEIVDGMFNSMEYLQYIIYGQVNGKY